MNKIIPIMFLVLYLGSFQVFGVSTYGVTLFDLSVVIFYILFIKKLIIDNVECNIILIKQFTCLLIFIMSIFICGLTPLLNGSSSIIQQYLKTSIHFLFILILPLIIFIHPIDNKLIIKGLRIWIILGFFINIFGIYQVFARAFDFPFAWLQLTNQALAGRLATNVEYINQLSLSFGSFYRATSIFSEPSALSGFNLYLLIFYFVPFIRNEKQLINSKIFNIIGFAVMLIAQFLCFSLTGLLGSVVIIIFGILFENRKRIISIVSVFCASMILLITADIIINNIINISVLELFEQRVTSISKSKRGAEVETIAGESFFGRQEIIMKGIELWKKNPLIGIGLGLSHQNKDFGYEFQEISFTHLLSELGLFGTIPYCFFFFSLWWLSFKYMINKKIKIKVNQNEFNLIGISFYLMSVQFITNFISSNDLIQFSSWFTFGIVISVLSIVRIKDGYKVYPLKFLDFPIKKYFLKYDIDNIKN